MSTTVTQLEPEVLKSRIERFRQVQSEIVTQVRRVIVGQEEVLEQVMIALFVGGHCLITGLAGNRQDPAGAHHGANARPGVQAHSVHARPDAQRHHRHRHHRRGPRHRPPHLDLRAGPDFRQHPAGRRNQPHASQDAERAARSHAGTRLHGARQSLRPAGAVLRAGHAEPHRAGRHLSAARSAARPLPLQHGARLPLGRGRDEGGRPDHGHHHPVCRRR